MKLITTTLLLSFLIPSSLLGQAKSNNSLPEKSINYGIDKTYEPYEFVDKEGNSTGFNVDLIKAIGKELNWEVEVYPNDWKVTRDKLEIQTNLNVATYFKTAAREDQIFFSRPISLVYYSIFTRSDKEPVGDLFSLSDKKVAIQEGNNCAEYFDQLGFLDLMELQTYSSESNAIDAAG